MLAVEFDHFGDAGVLELREVLAPDPISTEVRVRCLASSLNPVDVKTRSGSGVARWQGAPPYRLGWDVAGVVDALGYGVTRFSVGDVVYGMPWFPRPAGAYGELVTAPSLQFARAPATLPPEEAAGLPLAALTAWQALAGLETVGPDPAVLVAGATGGVGHLAVQLAKARGASVVAVARSSESRPSEARWLEELGADRVVADARDLGAGAADQALDLVGGAGTGDCLRAVRRGGVLLAVAEGAPGEVRAEAGRRGVRVEEPLVEPDGRALDEIARLVDAGRLRLRVDRSFGLGEVQAAHRYFEGRERAAGKILLRIG
jgi:NADPH:quinone reductase-like Zn-dependent oxidoreductase